MSRPPAPASRVFGLLLAARLLLPVALFLTVFGAKLALIRSHGSDVPYSDQWDAEAGYLYIPRAEHRLTAGSFFAPHNEHRIPATRALNYGLTRANGQWDPLLQMTLNAAVHAGFAAALLLLARRHVRGLALAAVAGLIGAMFVLPFAWENTLAGFQSQFYFLAWTSLGFLWLTLPAAPFSRRWWLGILVGVIGLGTMSSSFFCAAAALVIALGRAFGWERRRTARDLAAMAIYLALCVVGIALMTRVPGHEPLKASSPVQWFQVLCKVLSWPANRWLLPAFVLQLPLTVFALARLRARQLSDSDAVLLALALWCWAQAAAIAYARANFGYNNSPRYYDLYAIGVILNAIVLFRGWDGRRPRTWAALAVAWTALCIFGLWDQTTNAHRYFLDSIVAVRTAERTHVAQFVRDGNVAAFVAQPDKAPLDDAGRLAIYLSHPAVRAILPVSVRPPTPLGAAAATAGFARAPVDQRPGHPAGDVWRAAGGPARFVSEPLPAGTLPVLQFTFAGDAGLTPDIVHLESAAGHRSGLVVERLAGTRWQIAHLTLPAGGNVRLIVDLPAGPHAFAFADPVEMGRGSFYVHHLLKHATSLLRTGAALLLASLIVLGWREPRAAGA